MITPVNNITSRGIQTSKLLVYNHWHNLRDGPNSADSTKRGGSKSVISGLPKNIYCDFSGFLGASWTYDDEREDNRPWSWRGLHFYDPERQMCLEISAHSLSIWPERTEGSRFAGQGVESGKLRRFNFKLFTMTTRAIQTSYTNAGMGAVVDVGRIESI